MGRNSYNFSHYYRLTYPHQRARISIGSVYPLREATYLVGGQRPMQEHEPASPEPFETLKVIALPRDAIINQEAVLDALIMSANGDSAKPLVSRMVMRATPLSHSSDLRLDAIPIGDLREDLAQDMAREAALSPDNRDEEGQPLPVPDAVVDAMVKLILRRANNDPSHWLVSPGFHLNGAGGHPRAEPLDQVEVEYRLKSHIKGVGLQPGEPGARPFSFWEDLRFGPLTAQPL